LTQEDEREELNNIMEMKKKNREFQMRREEGWDGRASCPERKPCTMQTKPCTQVIKPCGNGNNIQRNGNAHVMVEDIECSEL
jgi:hypothetical protein